ncbi:hypothetical protein AQJ23_44975 [Streptomyces antibioticus]|nr:hypothetical protein [Streptomyces antibioticus]KUN16551.1 hypothetical protein AQJ23_44975 [Streptomyces antibioticus]
MAMEIDGESYSISPGAWKVFEGWRDKAYRDAWIVEQIEEEVRLQVIADLRAKAAKDWPGIGVFLDDIVSAVCEGIE